MNAQPLFYKNQPSKTKVPYDLNMLEPVSFIKRNTTKFSETSKIIC